MRVAMCISGVCASKNANTNLKKNHDRLKQFFPDYDFHYATWDSYTGAFEQNFPNQNCLYYPEPKINYHPYFDIPKELWESNRFGETKKFIERGGLQRREWTAHHTKQHLIHAWLCDTIKDSYDIVIRARFDTWIYKHANFKSYIQDTFENNRINAFSATKQNYFDKLNEFDASPTGRHHHWIVDQMIIHPMSFINRQYVEQLHNEKRLHPAEMGWYQVLSKPNGNRHRCFDGWVNHDKNVLGKFFK